MRSQFIPEDRVGANMLLVTFANWFLDELFRTEKNTNGTHYRRVYVVFLALGVCLDYSICIYADLFLQD